MMAPMTEISPQVPQSTDKSAGNRHAFGNNLCHLSATNGTNPCHLTKKARGNKPLTSSFVVGDNGFEPLTLCV